MSKYVYTPPSVVHLSSMKKAVCGLLAGFLALQSQLNAGGKLDAVKKLAGWAAVAVGSGAVAYEVLKPRDVEKQLEAQIQEILESRKQVFFDEVHPSGTATRVQVHEVKTTWRSDHPKSIEHDLKSFDVRFTIYWHSIFHRDGYTKISSTYDAEVGRFVSTDVLRTNGTTKSDVEQAIQTALLSLLFS